MGRTNSEDSRTTGELHASGFKLGLMALVPADNYIVTKDHPPVLRMTPAGAVDVLMPASDESTRGLVFIINNLGAGGIITLKTSADAAFSPTITIPVSGGWTMVICTGLAGAAGWVEIGGEIVVGA